MICESCNRRRAVVVVRWPDTVFAVCAECHPLLGEQVPTRPTPPRQPALFDTPELVADRLELLKTY